MILCDPDQETAWLEILSRLRVEAGGPTGLEFSSERAYAHLVLFVPEGAGAGVALDHLVDTSLTECHWRRREAGGFAVLDVLVDTPRAEPVVDSLLNIGSKIGLTLGGRHDYNRLALQAGLLSDGELLAMGPGLLAPDLLLPARPANGSIHGSALLEFCDTKYNSELLTSSGDLCKPSVRGAVRISRRRQ